MVYRIRSIVLILILLTLILAGCSPIEDTNGPDDKSLATITDAELATKVSGSISIGNSAKKGTPTMRREVNDNIMSDDDYDYDEIEFDFTRLNGTKKAMASYLTVGEVMTIQFSSQITSGNFAAVIISPDKKVLARFEADESGQKTITAAAEGDHFVILAGESAEGNVSIFRSFG